MKYPALFTKVKDGYTVTFRDIPEATTKDKNLEDVREMAADALLRAMEFYFEQGKSVPSPSALCQDEEYVVLPLSVWAKVQLLNLRLETGIRPVDLARQMGLPPQEMTRILDLKHSTKIDKLASAFDALGSVLNVISSPGMHYLLRPQGSVVSDEELLVADAVFRAYVDAVLGGSARAKQCFLAWYDREQGRRLTVAARELAQAWQDAQARAMELARLSLSRPEQVSFIARLA